MNLSSEKVVVTKLEVYRVRILAECNGARVVIKFEPATPEYAAWLRSMTIQRGREVLFMFSNTQQFTLTCWEAVLTQQEASQYWKAIANCLHAQKMTLPEEAYVQELLESAQMERTE